MLIKQLQLTSPTSSICYRKKHNFTPDYLVLLPCFVLFYLLLLSTVYLILFIFMFEQIVEGMCKGRVTIFKPTNVDLR